jgi:hypothetical protein
MAIPAHAQGGQVVPNSASTDIVALSTSLMGGVTGSVASGATATQLVQDTIPVAGSSLTTALTVTTTPTHLAEVPEKPDNGSQVSQVAEPGNTTVAVTESATNFIGVPVNLKEWAISIAALMERLTLRDLRPTNHGGANNVASSSQGETVGSITEMASADLSGLSSGTSPFVIQSGWEKNCAIVLVTMGLITEVCILWHGTRRLLFAADRSKLPRLSRADNGSPSMALRNFPRFSLSRIRSALRHRSWAASNGLPVRK